MKKETTKKYSFNFNPKEVEKWRKQGAKRGIKHLTHYIEHLLNEDSKTGKHYPNK